MSYQYINPVTEDQLKSAPGRFTEDEVEKIKRFITKFMTLYSEDIHSTICFCCKEEKYNEHLRKGYKYGSVLDENSTDNILYQYVCPEINVIELPFIKRIHISEILLSMKIPSFNDGNICVILPKNKNSRNYTCLHKHFESEYVYSHDTISCPDKAHQLYRQVRGNPYYDDNTVVWFERILVW